MRLVSFLVLAPSLAFAGDAALDCAFLNSNANCVKPAVAALQACAPPKDEIGKLAPAAKKSADSGSCTFSNGVTVSWKTTAGSTPSQTVTFAKDGKSCAVYEHIKKTKPVDDTLKLTVRDGAVISRITADPKDPECTTNCTQSLTCPSGQKYSATLAPTTDVACFAQMDFSGDLVASPLSASFTLSGADDPLFECDATGSQIAAVKAADGGAEIGTYTGSFSSGQPNPPEMKMMRDGTKIRVRQAGQDVGYIKVEPDQAQQQ